jgi:hypothetical protein
LLKAITDFTQAIVIRNSALVKYHFCSFTRPHSQLISFSPAKTGVPLSTTNAVALFFALGSPVRYHDRILLLRPW